MIIVASDHAGVETRDTLFNYIKDRGFDVKLCILDSDDVDYTDYALSVCESVISEECDKGILICGSGIGMSIAANKVPGIRAAVCHSVYTAKMSREHNDANVLCIGARILSIEECKDIIDVWLATDFEGGRHTKRLDKVKAIQDKFLCK